MSDLATALGPRLEEQPRPEPAPGDRLAAVLAIIVEQDGTLVFTERGSGLSRHPGEVSFPGGLQEPGDVDLRATALRETHEEIGLDPSLPLVLGALTPVHTFVSGILVTPFVATIPAVPEFVVDPAEIARVVSAPVGSLAAAEDSRELRRDGENVWRGWWYELPQVTVWGATGAMLHELLELLREEAPWALS